MKICNVLCVLAVAVTASVVAADGARHPLPSTVRLPQSSKRVALLSIPRGGASIDTVDVAKWYTRLSLLNGIWFASAPSKMSKLYNLDPTPLREWMADVFGHGLLSMFVFFHCLLDRKGIDLNHALAYSLIVWILSNLRHILDDKAVRVGLKKDGFIGFTLFHLATVYAVFSGHDMWANNLVKLEVILNMAAFLTFALDPQMAAKMWGAEHNIDNGSAALLKATGYCIAAQFGAAGLMLFQNWSAVEAVGFAALLWIIHDFDTLFVSKECDNNGGPKGPILVTMAVNAVVSYYILVNNGGGAKPDSIMD